MYLPSTLTAVLLLAGAEGVLGGSRLWEATAPSKWTTHDPDKPSISRRSLHIHNPNGNLASPRLWPNKKIRYCFEDTGNKETDNRLKALWDSAIEAWGELKGNGFSYEHVTNKKECDKFRTTVLRIYYNDKGKLASSLGIPPHDEAKAKANPNDITLQGPYTYLTFKEDVGQLNAVANAAHELGHVWGLLHEHQHPYYWMRNPGFHGTFPQINGENHFQTDDFICQNLKDYDEVHAKLQALIDAAPASEKGDLQTEKDTLCHIFGIAKKYNFGASEWLPYPNFIDMAESEKFDKESIMMYPSGSGGKVVGGSRLHVLTYIDGSEMKPRIAPSGMDFEYLKKLYGNVGSASLGVPHVSKMSKLGDRFRELRKKASFRRGGHSADIGGDKCSSGGAQSRLI